MLDKGDIYMEEVIRDILYILITGCGIAITKYIVDLVNKKINEIQVNTQISEYDQLNKYIDNAQDAISRVVLTLSQTVVDGLKKNNSFTKEAQEQVKQEAIDMAKKLITEEAKNAIIQVYGDFDVFLNSCIESMVKENKE